MTQPKRNLGHELLQAIYHIKSGKGREKIIPLPNVSALRSSLHLTQFEMATLLGVSMRTLQEWEQGRRTPSGPAQSLLHLMEKHPEIFVQERS